MRLIENYNADTITKDFILNNEWDIIKLNKKVDVEKLREWYFSVSSNLENLKFNFRTGLKYVKESVNNKFTTDTTNYEWQLKRNIELLQNSYSLSWFVEKDIPIPPPWAANLDYFPELKIYYSDDGDLIKDFDYSKNIYLKQYLYGEWENITHWLGQHIFNPRITEHMSGHILDLHKDGYLTRLHIPITIDNSKFYWGDNWDREYKLEPGFAYLINSKISHGTSNLGPYTRANIIADIYEDKILEIIKS